MAFEGAGESTRSETFEADFDLLPHIRISEVQIDHVSMARIQYPSVLLLFQPPFLPVTAVLDSIIGFFHRR